MLNVTVISMDERFRKIDLGGRWPMVKHLPHKHGDLKCWVGVAAGP